MFGDVPYRASAPVKADGAEVLSSRVITTKTKLTKADAQKLGLPKDKGTVYAWRVSVLRGDGGAYPVIEAMAEDNGRTPDGEVQAHFRPVENGDAVQRIAPAVAKAALQDWQAAQDAQQGGGLKMSRQSVGRFESFRVPSSTVQWLGFDGAQNWRADLAALAQRHPEYYESVDEVRQDIDYVMQRPDGWYIHGGQKVMVFREGDGNQVPQVRIEIERSGDGLVVRSVYVGNRRQIAKKMQDKRQTLERIGLGGQSLDSLTVAEYLAALGDRSSRPESPSDNSPDAGSDGSQHGAEGQSVFRSFAGQQAATADKLSLSSAQERIEAGEDAEVVRRDTGWHKAADGKWRFEISDADASLKIGHKGVALGELVDEAKYPNAVMPLADLLDHPALFVAYPALADMRVLTPTEN